MQKIINIFVEYFSTTAISVLIKLAGAAIVVLVGFFLTNWLIKLMQKSKLFGKIDKSVASFLVSVSNIGLKMVVVITAASILGVPLTAIITVFGTVGVAIGLALQGSLSHLAGGVVILLFRPFKVGDFIDTHSDSGTVESINIFYTKLITPDNREILVPNGQLSNACVINYSNREQRRVDLEFSASYSSDIDTVCKVMLETANAHGLVLKDPAPFARLIRQEDSALIFVLRVWCNSADYWTVSFDMNEQMKKAFDMAGIEIPFPQLDVHTK